MAEVKNSFILSKMNKDLDDRLIPNGEYRNAVNVSINKSTGENVGTAQTVLSNRLVADFAARLNPSNPPVGLEIIGVLPDDVSNKIYVFLTNNKLNPYIPQGAVGVESTYPNVQNNSSSGPITLTSPGSGYDSSTIPGTTTNLVVSDPAASGLTVIINTDLTAISGLNLTNGGNSYNNGTVLNVSTTTPLTNPGSGATVNYFASSTIITSVEINTPGSGYSVGDVVGINGGVGGQFTVSSINTSGAILSVRISSFGSGYTVGDTVNIDGSTGTSAVLTIDSILASDQAIISYNLNDNSFYSISEGSFLNFSTLYPITGLNLLEDLMFFTDNRNQPRKVNVLRTSEYYTTEDQISVAKYYPHETIELYQPSNLSSAVYDTGVIDELTNSSTITFSTPPTEATPTSSLGIAGSAVSIISGGTSYVSSTNVPTNGGSGGGLTVDTTASAGVITAAVVNNPGAGYTQGDTVTVLGSNGDGQANLTVLVIDQSTFIIDTTNWPNSIVVNQKQTLPAGTTINIVYPETTMQDAVSEYLPVEATGIISSFDGVSGFVFNMPFISFTGNTQLENLTIYRKNSLGLYEDTLSKVDTAEDDIASGVLFIKLTATNQASPQIFAIGDELKFSIKNPYFDNIFKNNVNIDFLEDKFVRFSYRYKFDDGEFSLIAPFTQPCFIPKQDGYFKSFDFKAALSDTRGEVVTDEEKAYRTTELEFMENKVNKIKLNIPLPSNADSINKDFKVEEIEILYKESDQTTIKVVENVSVNSFVSGSSPYYSYIYGSKPPFKTLPQKETTRVFDKVPVKALAQEVTSNRIVYGNYQDKHTPPNFLNYTMQAESKDPDFRIGLNKVDSSTSIVEYPNSSLKQNRSYEVGFVLSDRFGRQSTVIFSQTRLNFSESFIAASIYSPYRSEEDNQEASSNPTGGINNFDGDSLKVRFNDLISSVKNEVSGTPGLYNGDSKSPDYNPLGWYSFKAVVKQTEQEYYNVFLPQAMAAYPLDSNKEVENTSHIVLFNDNINKVPRDLAEVGPTQKEFPSSVRMFGRVNSVLLTNQNWVTPTAQFYPEPKADITSNIGTIKDLFNYELFPPLTSDDEFLFYNFDYLTSTSQTPNEFPDSSSLIARVSTQKKFGLQANQTTSGGLFAGIPLLNVYETAPTTSLIDIYYETSTSGRVDLLNSAIEQGPGATIFSNVEGDLWKAPENLRGQNASGTAPGNDIECTQPFFPVRFGGLEFTNPSLNTCEILSVTNQLNAGPGLGDSTNEDGVSYHDPVDNSNGIFKVEQVLTSTGTPTGRFQVVLSYNGGSSPGGLQRIPGLVVNGSDQSTDSYFYTFKYLFTNPEAEDDDGQPQQFIVTRDYQLQNVAPKILEVGLVPGTFATGPDANPEFECGGQVPKKITQTQGAGFNPTDDFGPLFYVLAGNGSSTETLDILGLDFDLISLGQKNDNNVFVEIAAGNDEILSRGLRINSGGYGQPSSTTAAYQAYIDVLENNALFENVVYSLTISVSDSANPQISDTCIILFVFSAFPEVSFGNGNLQLVTDLQPATSRQYNFDIKNTRWYDNQALPPPQQDSDYTNGVYFYIPVLVKFAPVKFTARVRVYNAISPPYTFQPQTGVALFDRDADFPSTPVAGVNVDGVAITGGGIETPDVGSNQGIELTNTPQTFTVPLSQLDYEETGNIDGDNQNVNVRFQFPLAPLGSPSFPGRPIISIQLEASIPV